MAPFPQPRTEEFSKMTENALKILKYVNTMQTYELTDVLRALSDEKQHISDFWIFSSSVSVMF